MRENQPVSQREYDFPDDTTLLSTTDLKSRIHYANGAFVAVSGFERTELLGQPHNLVRHPDMPREAFADMWATMKAGLSWTALVKNRRKNGDHYWVRANATPMRTEGRVTGYMSVRTKPSRDEVERAETLYRQLKEGRRQGLRLHCGLIVRTGLWAWTSALQRLPVRWRIRAAVLAPALALGAAWLADLPPAGLCAVGAGSLLAAAWWLERQIARPLQSVLAQALSVAAGQPANQAPMNRIDEIGMLTRAINQAGLNLRSLVDDVGEQVSGIRVACTQIAAGNLDLSSRTEQAAASLQQTASSMEQMNSTVKNNADTARQAAQLAESASAIAARGGAVVREVITTMDEITASSRRIAEIIGVIDGIAFQTNILALNAAVEAARAGEQGRGFAVVAGEVHTLAQRSAQAAREIKVLIGSSVEKVEAGARLVQGAGSTMDEIVSGVRRVNDLIAEISAATQEQTTGIDQVSIAVAQLDQVTQQNAALVEQAAAAAGSLQTQAEKLDHAVGVFSFRRSAAAA